VEKKPTFGTPEYRTETRLSCVEKAGPFPVERIVHLLDETKTVSAKNSSLASMSRVHMAVW
jgi:hypothetical protein